MLVAKLERKKKKKKEEEFTASAVVFASKFGFTDNINRWQQVNKFLCFIDKSLLVNKRGKNFL